MSNHNKEITAQLGRELAEHRKRFSLTQTIVGKQLGISQAQIARIEKGDVAVTENIIAKIQKLLRKPGLEYTFKVNSKEDKTWKYSYCVFPEKYPGDRVFFDDESLPDKTCIFHADAVGSDLAASTNADYLNILFECLLSSSDTGLSGELLYYRINKTIKNTKSYWRGEPSLNIILTHRNFDKIEIINAGMPDMRAYCAKDGQLKRAHKLRFPPPGAHPIKDFVSTTTVNLEKGDVLFSFSDGFTELTKRTIGTEIDSLLTTLTNAHKGDPEGIATKLSKNLTEFTKNRVISDDLSFLVISKK